MRSFLFVPANDSKRIERVHARGADVIVLDLEDAVAADAKAAARAAVRGIAEELVAKGATVYVRINSLWRAAMDDIEAVVCPAVAGVFAPKVENAARAIALGEMLREFGGGTGLIAMIESPAALQNVNEIAAVEGVTGLALGSEDFSAELGVPPSAESLDLACRMLALAAAARRLTALALPISIAEFRDLDAYRSACAKARAIGLTGALCIHPAQVSCINEAFAPGAAEIEDARGVLAAWKEAQAQGRAVAVFSGRMVDAPVVLRAERTLAIAEGKTA